ncbi:NAD-dependent epimerase/dehydratase family protein [Candidatus Magnetominusculus xianensis]|uniref:UDP-glucose 4-epimerase n=1 Tax=Candidatus Magnetominusculus xianensis TaxID=1748249 RepID=A0ABR5SEW9_9BACT|nr:SDR family oxidoreductase [Candidatus Magnetominusculus xianensis]KWT85302.1 UDP-glucose 4-epimerase [Candidatus Magnetominusculus xianensis]MBF0404813.1 SDR family oxidoreductase [Nitrospirota bacterium]
MMKKVFITGGAGYIGSIMIGAMLENEYEVIVLDRMFFGKRPVLKYLDHPKVHFYKDDVRYFDKALLKGVDVVIDLAGISNDPASEINPQATININQKGSIRVAKVSKEMGVRQYILASSCSIYGEGDDNLLNEESKKNPVSLYARSKIKAEEAIKPLADDNFCVTFLRNGTVYGYSTRMRFDLVVNTMTWKAWQNGKIHIMGGGQQWRPLVHVKDVVDAFLLVMQTQNLSIINGQAFNVGSNDQNYQIWQIANMVKNAIPNTELEFFPSDPDRRDYRVCCDKITNVLGFKTKKTVTDGIIEILDGLKSGYIDAMDPSNITVKYYKYLLEAEKALREIKYKGKIF